MKKPKKHTKKLWLIFIIALVAVSVAQVMIHPHVVFGPEGAPLFYAAFGFASCAAIVVVSKILGFFLKRKAGYYKEARHDHH